MKDFRKAIIDRLDPIFLKAGFSIRKVGRAPLSEDRLHMIQSFEEFLDQCQGSQKGHFYFVMVEEGALEAQTKQLKPKAEPEAQPLMERVYLADGKLNIPFLIQNAETLEKAKEFGLARKIYQVLAKSNHEPGKMLANQARCLEQEGQYDAAVSALEESIAYRPNIEIYEALAQNLIRAKREREAAEVIERALRLKEIPSQRRAELLRVQGQCWMRTGELDRAIETLKSTRKHQAPEKEVLQNLAEALTKRQVYDEAEATYREVLAANPGDVRALTGLGMVYFQSGRVAEAQKTLLKSLEGDLQQPKALYYLLRCAFESKDFEEAEEITSRYIEVSPINPNLLYSLAGMRYHLGKHPSALKAVRRLLELKPAHEGARELEALIQRGMRLTQGRVEL